jgi:hypothetical protein
LSYSSVLFAVQNAGLAYKASGEVFAYLTSTGTGNFSTIRDALQSMGAAWAGGADFLSDSIVSNRGYAAILSALQTTGAAKDGAAELLAYELSQTFQALSPPGSPLLWFDGQDVDGLGNANAALIDGQQIGTWVNKGSLGAAANAVQATAGIRPLFRKIAVPGKIGNLSALEGDGTKQLASALFASQVQPITWAIVVRCTGAGSQIFFSGPGGGHAHQLYVTGGTSLNAFAGTNAVTGQVIVANTFHQLGMVGNGAATTGDKDGVSVGPFAGGANDITGVSLFADTTPASFMTGFIAEVAAWQGAAPTLAARTAYFTAKFGALPQ